MYNSGSTAEIEVSSIYRQVRLLAQSLNRKCSVKSLIKISSCVIVDAPMFEEKKTRRKTLSRKYGGQQSNREG
jgi:hypothetical protein